jgi:hypothetical protein
VKHSSSQLNTTSEPAWLMAAILVSIVFFHDLNSAAEAGRLSIFIKDKSLERYTSFLMKNPTHLIQLQ